MPEKRTIERARKKAREGKAPTTQAGEFVREEMHHARSGKHPVRSRKQAIAIGLSKARRSGVKLPRRPKRSSSRAAPRSGARRAGARTSARKATRRTTRKAGRRRGR